MTFVYVMHEPTQSTRMHVKVGISNNPGKRLKENSTGNPYDLVLYRQFECGDNARLIEGLAHKALSKHKTKRRGEWFDADLETVVDCVSSLVQKYCGANPEHHGTSFDEDNDPDDGDDDAFNVIRDEDYARIQRDIKLSRTLPAIPGLPSFRDWFADHHEQRWWERAVFIKRTGEKPPTDVLNYDQLVDRFLKFRYDDQDDEQIDIEQAIEDATVLWLRYKSSRALAKSEIIQLHRQLEGFYVAWQQKSLSRNEVLPDQYISGRHFDVTESEHSIILSIHLSAGIRLRVVLTDKAQNPLDTDRRASIQQHEIKSAWVSATHENPVCIKRYQANAILRDEVLQIFLNSECCSCFRPSFNDLDCFNIPFFDVCARFREWEKIRDTELQHMKPHTLSIYRKYLQNLESDKIRMKSILISWYKNHAELNTAVGDVACAKIESGRFNSDDATSVMEAISFAKLPEIGLVDPESGFQS